MILGFGTEPQGADLALDTERHYSLEVWIDGEIAPAQPSFRSPIGDEKWRQHLEHLREYTENPPERGWEPWVLGPGEALFSALCAASDALHHFLDDTGPRRLVIRSDRPEVHRLPWEALHDPEHKRLLSTADLSIVHALGAFDDGAPRALAAPLRALAVMGREVGGQSLIPLRELGRKAETRRVPPVRVEVVDFARPIREPPTYEGDLVHVEVHGELGAGTLSTGAARPGETPLADRFTERALVLLWSCHSGVVHSWGESLAMRLHRQGNDFVLGFVTPLRFDAAGEMARVFYQGCFQDADPFDPEAAVIELRRRAWRERRSACEWASLTVWAKRSLDLVGVRLDGPRALPAEGGTPLGDAALSEIARQIEKRAYPGRTLVLQRTDLSAPFPPERLDLFRGTVVQIRADDPPAVWKSTFARTRQPLSPPSSHRGDCLVALIDALGKVPESLLLVGNATEREVDAVAFADGISPTLAVVLATRGVGPVPPGVAAHDMGLTAGEPVLELSLSPVEALLDLADRGHFREGSALHDQILGGAAALSEVDLVRAGVAGYWCKIRLGLSAEAEACLERVERLDPLEGKLLRGNFVHRRGEIGAARRLYEEVAEGAAGDGMLQARAVHELAYLADENEDKELALVLYGRALARLEKLEDGRRDWAASLGRALRDHADNLADRPDRLGEADRLLRRALAVNAIDGRTNQIGYVLLSRGKLLARRGDTEGAERRYLEAADVLHGCGNLLGWASAMERLIELAIDAGRLDQAAALARGAGAVLRGDGGAAPSVAARIELLEARLAFRSGQLPEARAHAEAALASPGAGGGRAAREATVLVRTTALLLSAPREHD